MSEQHQSKSGWDKVQILLAPVGGLLTALAVACVGFFGSRYINAQQQSDTNHRVYAELMSRREEADVQLRKDMFNSIISTFLAQTKPGANEPQRDVLKLELLAYNFHDSLDLGPLFKQVYRQIDSDSNKEENSPYLARLQRVSAVVTGRQLSALREAGQVESRPVDLQIFDSHPEGIPIYEGQLNLPLRMTSESSKNDPDAQPRLFSLELLHADPITREINVRLRVSFPGSSDIIENPEMDKSFWVGFFDFPMIDNTRLSHDQRCAVVLEEYEPGSKFAQLSVVFFPGDRASLKEKPYYDDVLHNLRRAEERLKSGGQ